MEITLKSDKKPLNLFLRILLFALALVAIQLPIVLLALGGTGSFPMWAAEIGVILYLALMLLVSIKMGLWTKKGHSSLGGKAAALGKSIAGTVGIMIVARILLIATVAIFLGTESTSNDQTITAMATVVPKIWMAIVIGLTAPLGEEIVFRGIFFRFFFNNQRWLGAVISATLFSIVHGPTEIVSFLIYFSMGFIFSGLYLVTKRFEMNFLGHFLNNLLPALIYLV